MRYKPIDCNFYDELEALATFKKQVEIQAENNDGPFILQGIINDFRIIDGAEHLVMSDGQLLRLDYIKSVAVV